MHPEDQPHPRVLPPDVRLPLPQLNVSIPQLQDPRTVNAGGGGHLLVRHSLIGQERPPNKQLQSSHQSCSLHNLAMTQWGHSRRP